MFSAFTERKSSLCLLNGTLGNNFLRRTPYDISEHSLQLQKHLDRDNDRC